MENQIFGDINTQLDLNGPILSFTLEPVGVGTTATGSVTLTGIATATFPTQSPPNTPDAKGSIAYQWYEENVGMVTDGTNVTGSATTTLVLSNLATPGDSGRKFYLQADYVPLDQVGIGYSTGNAINEPKNSGIATITVDPLIEIVAQPPNRNTVVNTNVSFTVDASLTNNAGGLSYKWYLNGEEAVDGVKTVTTTTSSTVAGNVENFYSSPGSHTIPATSTDIEVTLAGARGGGGGSDAGGPGGGWGHGKAGKFTFANNLARTLQFNIGSTGNGGGSGSGGGSNPGSGGSSPFASGGRGGNAGPGGWSGSGGGGGGASGVHDSVVGGYVMVAGGGGGGGGGSHNRGGYSGNEAPDFNPVSGAITGNSAGSTGGEGGGDGGGGGGGGGGAPGNSGGGRGWDNNHGGYGGLGGHSKYTSPASTLTSQWLNAGAGYANLKYTGYTTTETIVVTNTTLAGTDTNTLTIQCDRVGIQTVACVVSHDTATNSPVTSDVSNFTVIDNADEYKVNIETIGTGQTATISQIDLFNGDHEFVVSGTNEFDTYSFYSPDKNIDVEVDLYGGKGFDQSGYTGGEGGYSRVRFTMIQNTEYVFTGFSTTTNTPFLYRKGALMACVGRGGSAGTIGNGGFGGGIGVGGEAGYGRGGGTGGAVVAAGSIGSNGVFGSQTSLTATTPDTKAAAPTGGTSISCTKGVYWAQQGVGACDDLSSGNKFRLGNGTLVDNTSSSITRGFKAGYNIMQTAGSGTGNGGQGGDGATGGNGGTSGAGGGGGSGYTDGSVTVVSNTLGGSTSNTKAILRVVT